MATGQNNPFFTPRQISGCQLWLDAADTASFTLNGSSITQWNDKSGNANHAQQGTLANSPTLSTSNVSFNGSQWLTTPITSAPTAESFFIVFNTSGNSVVDLFAGTSSGFREVIIYLTNIYVGKWGNAPTGTNGGAISTNVRLQLNYQYNTSIVSFSVNGSVTGSGTPPFTFTGSGTSYIGSSTYSPNNFVGTMNEILYFNSSLSSSQRQQIEGYLAWKWGLQGSLPATHPYKSTPIPPLLSPPTSIPTMLTTSSFSDWSPTQISGCQLWLDATDSSSVTLNSTSVTQWSDKSGNARHLTQSTLSNSPNYTRVNSNYMIDFVRANKTYLINASYSQIYTNFTLYMIIKRKAAPVDTERIFVAIPVSYATDWNTQTGFSFSSTIELAANGSGTSFSDGSNLNVTMYSILTSSNSANVYKNADTTSVISRSLGLTGNSIGILLGSGTNSGINTVSEQFNGYIGEVILFTKVLTSSERQQIEGYLAFKWGLQPNIPTTHPYKTQVPIKSGFNVYALTSGAQARWLPTRISGCQLWLDAADPNATGVTPANGSTISTWKDKSSNGFSGTAVNSPTVQINALNKLPVVRFNGTNQYINFGNVLNLGTNPLTIFVITKFDTTNESGIIGKTAYAAANMRWALWYGKSGVGSSVTGVQNIHQDDAQTGSSLVSTNPVTIGTQYNLYTYVTSRNTFLLNLNGSLAGSVSSTGTPSNFSTSYNLYVGAYADSTGSSPRTTMYLNGDIAEILVYFTNLSASQYQQVEGYLAWKWGVQGSLPSTHPFAKWPPPP